MGGAGMIFWEEADGTLPNHNYEYGQSYSTNESIAPYVNDTGTTVVSTGAHGGSGTTYDVAGNSVNQDGTTATESGYTVFTSSFSFTVYQSGTFAEFIFPNVFTRSSTATGSGSRTYSFYSSSSWGGTTHINEDGSTVEAASAHSWYSSSSSTNRNGATRNGSVDTPGGYADDDEGGDIDAVSSPATIVDDPQYGNPIAGTSYGTLETTLSSWSVSTHDVYIRTIVAGVLGWTTINTTYNHSFEVTITLDGFPVTYSPGGYAPWRAKYRTRVRADKCKQLYYAGEYSGMGHWCDVWDPISVGLYSPDYVEYDEPEVNEGGEYDAGGGPHRTNWSSYSASGVSYSINSEYYYGPGEPDYSPAVIIALPAAYGVQHYRSLDLGDTLYGSYSINVAASCTVVSERASRQFGYRYNRGNITQVATLNSNDTLVVGGAGGTYTSGQVNRGGGEGIWHGDNSVKWPVGVYDYTKIVGGSPVTARVTYTSPYTEISPRGVLWTIVPQRIAFGGTPSDYPDFFMEMECVPPYEEW